MNDKAFHFLILQLGQLTPSQRHQLPSYFQQVDTGAADKLLVEHSPPAVRIARHRGSGRGAQAAICRVTVAPNAGVLAIR